MPSWWYPKDATGAVTTWLAEPFIFPDGLDYVYNQTGWPIQVWRWLWRWLWRWCWYWSWWWRWCFVVFVVVVCGALSVHLGGMRWLVRSANSLVCVLLPAGPQPVLEQPHNVREAERWPV
jgi:hypothetical protein